jgi:hypothetical protein
MNAPRRDVPCELRFRLRVGEISLHPIALRKGWLWFTAGLAVALALGVIAYVTYDLFPPWLRHAQDADARWLQRTVAIGFLDGLLVAYGISAMFAVVGMLILVLSWRRTAGRWNDVRPRLLVLGISVLVSLVALELGAAAWQTWLHRKPRLPAVGRQVNVARPEDNDNIGSHIGAAPTLPDRLPDRTSGVDTKSSPLKILVIGESSGRGEPYNPWLSVGQIVAWRLEEVFPGRKIEADIWAKGGADLEMAHNTLSALRNRPDALIVYAGHNEFATRVAWMRDVEYYLDADRLPRALGFPFFASLQRLSPLCRLIAETRERQRIDMVPPRVVTRELVDRPICTSAEKAAILSDFGIRLEAIASYCETIGTLPIFIIPPSNDAGFDPSRSILAPDVPRSGRVAFARSVAQARALETKDCAAAMRIDRELVSAHPEFAEAHYRLARLLEQTGCWDEARDHYIAARECDAFPLRCPDPFRQAYRDVAARHPNVLLVDGPKVLENKSRHGIVDYQFFHDAQHPNLRGYAALAEDVLNQLGERRAFCWPQAAPVPFVDVEACARHFQLDARRWETVCARGAGFFRHTTYARYDPKFRAQQVLAYERAATALRAGVPPADAGIPGWPFPPKLSRTRIIP